MTIPCRFEHLQDSIPLFSVFIEAIESLFCISFLCKEWCNGSLPLQFYKFFADFYILSTHQDVFRSIFCIFRKFVLSLQPENKLFRNMTTLQMNAELFHQLSIIAKDENLMAKLLKYTRKLTAKMEDPTLMTKEEFFARVDEAKKGSSKSFANVDELDKFIRAL